MISKTSYFTMCESFDWYYNESDDFTVWNKGLNNDKILMRAYQDQPELEPIYEAWRKYFLSGKDWGTEKAPEPKIGDFI